MTDMVHPKDLVALRREGKQRRFTAAELPGTIAAAYDAAAAGIGLLARPVGAWKLGATTATTRAVFATEEVYFGGLIDDEVWSVETGGSLPAPAQFQGEAEIAFRLAVDLAPGELGQTAGPLFDAWAPAIEAPYSCIVDIPGTGLNALLADRCAAGGLYLGAARFDLDSADIDASLEILINGELVAKGAAPTGLLMPPLAGAERFLTIAAARGVTVCRGQWISTGGITPCVPLPFDSAVSLRHRGQEAFNIVVPSPVFGAGS